MPPAMALGPRRLFRGRRREAPPAGPELRAAASAFREALEAVESAKASLVRVVRAGRAPGVPLAEALAEFEEGLAEAAAGMPAWRSPEIEREWVACSAGLVAARDRAEALRLRDEPPAVYETLIATLEDLMDPLEPFERAAEGFRARGIRS
jgi:hypothetical protein